MQFNPALSKFSVDASPNIFTQLGVKKLVLLETFFFQILVSCGIEFIISLTDVLSCNTHSVTICIKRRENTSLVVLSGHLGVL